MDSVTIQRRRWVILSVLVLSLLVVVLDTSILNVALRTIADPIHGLGADQEQLEWATDAYTLAFAGLLFTAGILADRLGRKRLLLAGMAVFGIGSLLAAYSASPDQLIAFRALMGFGGAMIMPSTLSIITNVFEPRERGKAIGIWAGASGVAIAIGPVTGGLLLEHFWWGSVFLVNVPIVIVALIAMTLIVPDSRDPDPGKLDPLGVLLSLAGLVSLVFGVIRGGDLGSWTQSQVWGPIVGAVAALAAFIWWELRIDHPALRVTLFRKVAFSSAIAVVFLVFLALAGLTFFLSFYLQNVRGYSALQAGLCLLPLAVGQILSTTRSNNLVNRFGPKLVCSTGMALVAASFTTFLFVDADTALWIVLVAVFLIGAGMGNVMPPATNAVMGSVPRNRAGEGSAVNNTMRQVGSALGIAGLGSILTQAYSSKMLPHLDEVPGLPASTAHNLSESIASTMSFIDDSKAAHPQVGTLIQPAKDSFVHAMHLTTTASVAISIIGLLVAAIWIPRHPVTHTPDAPSADQTQPPVPAASADAPH